MWQSKKSGLHNFIRTSCDELRFCMDASQCKDNVLLLIKYVSDSYANGLKTLFKMLLVLTITIYFFISPFVAFAAEQGSSAKVVLQLKWTHLFQFAGYYAALEKGYYRDAGLDVSFLEAGPDINPVTVVLTGKANFGIGTSELLLHRVLGDKVVVLAALFQHSPLSIMSLRDGPVQSIHDLSGRRIMIEPGSAELYAYFRKEYLPRDHMSIVTHSHKVEDLLNRSVDAMSVYDTDEPYSARMAGAEVNLFSARSVGIDFYGDCLFTSEEYLVKNPEMVRKFREASLRGWRYALEHQSEMVDLIRARYLPERSRDQLLFEAQKTAQLMQANLVEIGYVNPGRWKHIAETYAELGMIPKDASLDGFIYQQEPSPINKSIIMGIIATSLLACLAILGLVRYAKLNRRLAISESLYRSLLSASPDGVAVTDLEGRIRIVSPKTLALFGFEKDAELLGLDNLDFIVPEDRERARANIGLMFQGVFTGPGEYRGIKADGSNIDIETNADFVRDAAGSATGLVMVIREISDRKQLQEKLKMQASTDGLTGLFNRRHILENIQTGFDAFHRSGTQFSLLLADIDYFKQVNDVYGHNGGDFLLRAVAEELVKESRSCDTVSRWGGEEFLCLLPETEILIAMRIAERMRSRFAAKTFIWEGEPLSVSLTFGVAAICEQDTVDSVIDRADRALYRGKKAGRNRVVNGNELQILPAPMGRINWNPKWESGNQQVDDQHRQLLRMATQLIDMSIFQSPGSQIGLELDCFLDHVTQHFATEEAVLQSVGYPETEYHAAIHAKLVVSALLLKEKFLMGEVKPADFFEFLVEKVVMDHMLTEDVKFFPFLRV